MTADNDYDARLLALGQVLADIPEGFAVIANFREGGVARRKLYSSSCAFELNDVY